MANLLFKIPGRIGAKGRPRFARRGAFVRTYTDAKTISQEAIVRHYASEAMGERALLTGPVKLRVVVEQHTPPSWSKKRKRDAHWVTGKPDTDNQIKLLADSMNGIVFADDAQIAEIEYGRYFVTDESPECVTVEISELAWIQAEPWIQRRGLKRPSTTKNAVAA